MSSGMAWRLINITSWFEDKQCQTHQRAVPWWAFFLGVTWGGYDSLGYVIQGHIHTSIGACLAYLFSSLPSEGSLICSLLSN